MHRSYLILTLLTLLACLLSVDVVAQNPQGCPANQVRVTFGGTCRCPANTYGTGSGDGFCTTCPAGSSKGSGFSTVYGCQCTGGRSIFGSDGTGYSCGCYYGSYSSSLNQPCTACPDNGYTANPGATSINQCICPSNSFLFPSNNPVQCACQANFYKSGSYCYGCFAHSTSLPASTSFNDCKCDMNYYKYPGQTTCFECPVGSKSTVPSGSTDYTDCKCQPGWYSINVQTGGVPCAQCPPGTYSDTVGTKGVAGCKPCPDGTFSTAFGITSAASCQPCTGTTTNDPSHTTCTATSTVGMGNGRKRSRYCPPGKTACPIFRSGGSSSRGQSSSAYECVDIMNDLQSCGGCWSVGGLSDAKGALPVGQDCSTFDDDAIASCVKGKCHYECPSGTKLTATGCIGYDQLESISRFKVVNVLS